jgi:hypothetical protein
MFRMAVQVQQHLHVEVVENRYSESRVSVFLVAGCFLFLEQIFRVYVACLLLCKFLLCAV